jgi:hypothetical protein
MDMFRRSDSLERRLRSERPQPSDALISRIEGRVAAGRPRRSSLRYAIPAALTLALVTALAAVGGVSYAATGVSNAAKAVAKVFAPAKQHSPVVVAGLSADSDQYRPGFGWGDENHTHTGPPGLERKGGAFAPPLTATTRGKTAFVSTAFTIDEQAHLTISVINAKTGKKLLLTQQKSAISGAVKGPQTKNVQYLLLVPRSVPLKLAIPANLVAPGNTYFIQIRARSPLNKVSLLKIPFHG